MRNPGRRSTSNQIRIIGGEWRGRKLSFPSAEGLRPTGDRIRETLFNWLGQNLSGARVLDLFAGSGALGIEALSRGAASAIFVDSNRQVCMSLNESLASLPAENGGVFQQSAENFLRSATPSSVDLLFLDPPFARNLHAKLAQQVEDSGILAPGAMIYVESPANSDIALPVKWSRLKGKKAGDVHYQLLQPDCDNQPI